MANITPVDNWSDIPQIEQTDYVLGGEGQIANQQAQALANRTLNLKNTVTANKTAQDNKNISIDSAINDLDTNKINKSDIVNNATTTTSGKVLDGRMGKTLNDIITSNYNTLNTNKINKSDIVTNYTTNDNTKVLSASVGVSLKALIDGKQPSGSYVLTSNVVNNVTTTTSGKVLDGRVGKTLKDLIDTANTNINTKINKSDIVTDYTTNNTSKVLAASVGVSLKALIDGKQPSGSYVLTSNVVNNYTTTTSGKVLDARVGASLKALIDTANTNITNLTNNKVNKSDIVNNATTTTSGKVLDGRMGKTLNDLITTANTNITNLSNNKVNKSDIADNLTTDSSTKVLSAKQGKLLNEKIVSSIPIGAVLPYFGADSSLPSTFQKCAGQTLTKASYPELFNAFLSAGMVSSSATSFVVPDLRKRYLKGSIRNDNQGYIGSLLNEKLPNIEGSWRNNSNSGTEVTGCYYIINDNVNAGTAEHSKYYSGGNKIIGFSARRSNSIYGWITQTGDGGQSVIPLSCIVNWIIRVK